MSVVHEIIAAPIGRHDSRLIVSRIGNPAALADLDGKRGYLMVSVKNSSFTAEVVETFCDLAERHLDAGEVILVDAPYMAPILASEPDGEQRRRRIANLHKAASDRRRFVETILGRRGLGIPIRDFAEVEREVAPELLREVRDAFDGNAHFRDALLARSREVIPATIPDGLLPRYAQFLVSEIPILCHLYYGGGAPGVVDVYPGENPPLFWNIERGRFADALPRITAMAARSPGLIYVDVAPGRRLPDGSTSSSTMFEGR